MRPLALRISLCAGLCLFTIAMAGPLSAGKDKKKPSEVPPRKGTSMTINLFNGKNLEGWEGYEDLWSVKDGVIVSKNSKPIKFSTYLLTKQTFTDFRLI